MQIVLEGENTEKEEVVEEIKRFEKWFMEVLQNADPLNYPERAILNDYLAWKIGAREK